MAVRTHNIEARDEDWAAFKAFCALRGVKLTEGFQFCGDYMRSWLKAMEPGAKDLRAVAAPADRGDENPVVEGSRVEMQMEPDRVLDDRDIRTALPPSGVRAKEVAAEPPMNGTKPLPPELAGMNLLAPADEEHESERHIKIAGKFGEIEIDDHENGEMRVFRAPKGDMLGMLLVGPPKFGVKMKFLFDNDGEEFVLEGVATDMKGAG